MGPCMMIENKAIMQRPCDQKRADLLGVDRAPIALRSGGSGLVFACHRARARTGAGWPACCQTNTREAVCHPAGRTHHGQGQKSGLTRARHPQSHALRTELPPAMIRRISAAAAWWLSTSVLEPIAFSWVAAASARTPMISCSGNIPASFSARSRASQIERAAIPECV